MLTDVSRHFLYVVANTTAAALAVCLVVAGAVAWWVRRANRTSRPYGLLFAAFAALGLILTLTVVRDVLYFLVRDGLLHLTFTPGQLFHWSLDGWRRISYDPFGDSEVLLNIALFVPAGVAWTLLTGRPLRVLAALVGLSFLVECVQAVTGAGVNDVADLVSNSAGAAVGVLAGTVVLWLVPRLGRRPRPSRRRIVGYAAALVTAAAVTVAALHIGAANRQAGLEQELVGLFSGTTLEQYRAWEAEDRLYEEVFAAASVFTSGAQDLDELVRVRYPASFFGVRRCVFVEWTSRDARVYRGSGDECTAFIG